MNDAQDRWNQIIQIAGRAPSTHNTQGWRIKVVSDKQAYLLYDKERTLPAEDIHGDFNIINMGIFERGVEIAANSLGYGASCKFILPKNQFFRHTNVASITLKESDAERDPSILELFLARRTSRLPYDGRNIEGDDLSFLKNLTSTRGHDFSWTQDDNEVEWYIELNANTISEDLQNSYVRKELRDWMRFSRNEAEEKRDGLWAECMNQNPLEMRLATACPGILEIPPLKKIFRKYYMRTQAGTPAIGWIEGSIGTREEQFEAGRFLLDFWLKLTEFKIWMLPFGSLYTNMKSNKMVGERTKAPKFWLIFRMGYGPTPPESFRLEPEKLFIT